MTRKENLQFYTQEWVKKMLESELDRFERRSAFILSLADKVTDDDIEKYGFSKDELINTIAPSFYIDAQISLEFMVVVFYKHFLMKNNVLSLKREDRHKVKYKYTESWIKGISLKELEQIRDIGNSIKHSTYIENPIEPEIVRGKIIKTFKETIKAIPQMEYQEWDLGNIIKTAA